MYLKDLEIKDTKGPKPGAVFTSERALHTLLIHKEKQTGII